MSARFVAIFLFLPSWLAAQQIDFQRNFSPSPLTDTIPATLQQKLLFKKESFISKHAYLEGSIRNSYKRLQDYQFKSLIKQFNGDYFITQGFVVDYLAQVLSTIRKANPQDIDEPFVVAHRTSAPNASSMDNGLIVVNTSLISRLENKGQLAYVISHELAHYYLNHSDERLVSLATLDNDPSLRKELRSIVNNRVQQYTRMKTLEENLDLSLTQYSRAHEFEADSLGYVLFSRAGYNPNDAVRLLEILDSVDFPKYRYNANLRRDFTFPEQPFKESWDQFSHSPMYHVKGHDERFGDSDTIKTHPDISRRISVLKKLIRTEATPVVIPDPTQMMLGTFCDFDQVESAYHFKNYGSSLFMALMLLERYPENTYLHAMIGRNLYAIYNCQKNHTLGRSVNLPDLMYDENYNRVLDFINKLRLSEVAAIGMQYLNHCPEKDFEDDEFLYSFWLMSQLPGSIIDPQTVKDTYISKFPQGHHISAIKKPLNLSR